ncbi:MAG: Asp-tRNA(Asn)/Glu-tRNA(Gln) amidotransferase subunit GatB [Bacilli bacterium]|nr:Asp-tRNA(Asn)/Glu-tRNA(Gln) amidotransferase subunit GatB [Bacilli bacterium]
MDNYQVMIGLEMHCEMSKTNSKVFSSAKNGYSDEANSFIRPVDLAFPGTLPVVNKEAVRLALKASMILNCKQPEYMYFERKNYYYPDLPKGYQITQETKPAPVGIYGYLDYEFKGETKRVRINNIHLEEDSASQDHYPTFSTLDYNRAGVPLLELVTEPDMHSAEEAVAFLEAMRAIYQYADISDADSKKGQIRCDVNVSICDKDKDISNPDNWGTKVEIKNVNSFGGVRDAINYEIDRQIALKESGEYDKMEQQTRRFDEDTMTTIYMRNKANAIDYKYFVEPNIPKFKITGEWLDEIRATIPEMPIERKNKYMNQFGLSEYDASILVKEKDISNFYEETLTLGSDPKKTANWLTSTILGYLNKNELEIKDIYLTPKMLFDLMKLVDDGKISSKQSKEVLTHVLEDKKDPNEVVKSLGMEQIGDDNLIRELAIKAIEEHLELIEEYRKGRNVFDFFVGQIMKATRGQANPSLTAKIIKEEIDKR